MLFNFLLFLDLEIAQYASMKRQLKLSQIPEVVREEINFEGYSFFDL